MKENDEEKEFESVMEKNLFELLPVYIDEELSWSVKSIAIWDSKEQAERFKEFLTKRIYS